MHSNPYVYVPLRISGHQKLPEVPFVSETIMQKTDGILDPPKNESFLREMNDIVLSDSIASVC